MIRPVAVLGYSIIGALALIMALLTYQLDRARDALAAEKAAHAQTVAGYRLAAEKARADDLAHARATEQRYAAIAQETQDDLTARLAAARADADRYAARLREAARADQGGVSRADLPVAAEPASRADGAGEATELDDARACAEAVTKAEGWREWWGRVSARD